MLPSDLTKGAGKGVIVSAELIEDLEHGRGLTDAAISERTRKVYDYEFGRFQVWAERHGLAALPTTAAVVATYLAHVSKRGASPATLAVVRAAIKHQHATLPPNTEGRTLDLATPEIKRMFQGARRKAREAGRRTNKAKPWLVDDFRVLAATLDPGSLEDVRDLALIGLGLSKTHQVGDGEALRIEEGPALQAVRAWVRAAGIKPGTPLWRAVRKGWLQPGRMHQRTLHNIIQRRARRMLQARGLSPPEAAAAATQYSTHSLRRGALTSMGKAGATVAELMDLGRHSPKSASIVLGYVEPEHIGARRMRALGL